ncbi:hypothetical protein U5801_28480 [Lamprobacter modestohalophilus]|uniref:hypothetical protein n=1 Tax=Lamprobacter modestohalophilus TaxID=1064514 RepID=UPI002ADEC776|nr:hypothetical protein [Lamprobacter modestohalophilus]MEA1053715.1 hypothetical protein [Lamprobacter modestohalophilus]
MRYMCQLGPDQFDTGCHRQVNPNYRGDLDQIFGTVHIKNAPHQDDPNRFRAGCAEESGLI